MKIYLLNATINCGQHEHTAHALVRAHDKRHLKQRLAKLFKYDAAGFDAPGAYFGYGDESTISELSGSRLITAEEAATLEQLNVVHFV